MIREAVGENGWKQVDDNLRLLLTIRSEAVVTVGDEKEAVAAAKAKSTTLGVADWWKWGTSQLAKAFSMACSLEEPHNEPELVDIVPRSEPELLIITQFKQASAIDIDYSHCLHCGGEWKNPDPPLGLCTNPTCNRPVQDGR